MDFDKNILISFDNHIDYDLIRVLLNRLNIRYKELDEEIKLDLPAINNNDDEERLVIKNMNTIYDIDFSDDTIDKVIRTIELIQKNYFTTGLEKYIVPMILNDVAEVAAKDLSTVSRIIATRTYNLNGKEYLYKDLFSQHDFSTNDGRPVSKFEIYDLIKKITDNEDKNNPLSDELMTEELRNLGYNIQRRTVTKYRKELSIENSHRRRI